MLQKLRRQRALVPLLTLMGGVVASALIALLLLRIVDTRDHSEFQRNIDQAQDVIRDRLDSYITVLRAGVGLFAAIPAVDKEGFHAFIAGLRLKAEYPGIQGVGFSARVAPEDRDSFTAVQRRKGAGAFRIWPEESRPEVHTIIYLEPLDRRNEAAIGYDMSSDPIRREAMERARDTGQPAASGRVELVQEIDEAKQAGFLVYMPVYRGGDPPETAAERRERLAGFVFGAFRADDLFGALFRGGRNPGLDLRVYDGPSRPDNLLHRSSPPRNAPGGRTPRYSDTRTVQIAGRQWTVAYLSDQRSELGSTRTLIPLIFAGGLLASVLVSGAVWAEARARTAADLRRMEAQRRAQELAVLNRAGASVAAELDLDRVVQTVTDAGVELTGAAFGAFFYNVTDQTGGSYMLYTLSGAPREAFAQFPMPRATAIFGPTFRGEGIVRSEDILQDPRYGLSEPHRGMPKGHLPVRSYLAIPVASRSGEVLGGLFFGHPEPGRFTAEHEHLMAGVAAQAAIAIDNARLYQAAQTEIQERKRAEAALRESESRLRLALEAGRMAVWELDLATDATTGTPELYRLLGFPPDAEVSQPQIRAGYLPGERERLLAIGQEAMARGERSVEAEYQYRRADGDLRWFLLRADIVAGDDGRPKTAIGVIVDVTERRRAEEGLRESEERLRLALQAGGLGTWELDLRANRRLLSPRSAEIFGMPAEALLDRRAWQEVVHADDRLRTGEALDEALRGGRPYTAEYRVLSRDGGVRWVSSQAVVRRGAGGEPLRVVGIHQDITDRKRWEEHQTLLINELNHRVKNTLATVQSISSQTLRNAVSMQQARHDLEERLFALSRVHDVLTRENWEAAGLREMVERAVEPYRRNDDRFRIEGADIRVPPRMALALALALQELTTNAIKYGALSNAVGRVRMSWTVDGAGPGRRMTFVWEESGGPEVHPPTRSGFGKRLIERTLALELGGDVRMQFRPSGLRCTAEVPMP